MKVYSNVWALCAQSGLKQGFYSALVYRWPSFWLQHEHWSACQTCPGALASHPRTLLKWWIMFVLRTFFFFSASLGYSFNLRITLWHGKPSTSLSEIHQVERYPEESPPHNPKRKGTHWAMFPFTPLFCEIFQLWESKVLSLSTWVLL